MTINKLSLAGVALATGFLALGSFSDAATYTTLIDQGTSGLPFRDYNLAGNTLRSEWLDVKGGGSVAVDDVNSRGEGGTGSMDPSTGGHPGNGPWSSPFAAQRGDTSVVLNRTGMGATGGPYRGSASIYFGSFGGIPNTDGGSLQISTTAPLTDLQTVILQMQILEVKGYDFVNDELPVLSYTTASGTVKSLAADFSGDLLKIYNGTFTDPSTDINEPLYINAYGLQWDLSGETEAILSFSIDFNAVEHAQFFGAQLDQSSESYSGINMVPEPGATLLGLLGTVVILGIRRNR